MDESLPATSPPGDTAASGSTPPEEQPVRKHRRLRVPTSVLVTVLGIALTAWLLPAFTRQWDDRQKEQELKAELVTDMAAATSRALIGGEAIWDQELRPRKVNRAEIADGWSRAAVEIEARLNAYFPRSTVVSWQIYTWFVDRYVDGYRAQAYASLLAGAFSLPEPDYNAGAPASLKAEAEATAEARAPVRPPVELHPNIVKTVARVLAYAAVGSTDPRPNFDAIAEGTYESGALSRLTEYLGPQMKIAFEETGLPGQGRKHFRLLQARLNEMQHEIALQVLSSHARGFSTTRGDLLRDLLP